MRRENSSHKLQIFCSEVCVCRTGLGWHWFGHYYLQATCLAHSKAISLPGAKHTWKYKQRQLHLFRTEMAFLLLTDTALVTWSSHVVPKDILNSSNSGWKRWKKQIVLRTTQGTRVLWGPGRRAGTAGGTPGPGELPCPPSHEGYMFILIHDPMSSWTNMLKETWWTSNGMPPPSNHDLTRQQGCSARGWGVSGKLRLLCLAQASSFSSSPY